MKWVRVVVNLCFGFLLPVSVCQAQTAPQPRILYVNQFQQFVQEKNIDSAFHRADQLSLASVRQLNLMLHDSFAQNFATPALPNADTAFAGQLLNRLNTGSPMLQKMVYPLREWVRVKTLLNDSAVVNQLVTAFMTSQAAEAEERSRRIDRYALLIYEVLKQKQAYAVLADTLLERTRQRLEHAVNGLYYFGSDVALHRETRAYFRYLMACVYGKKAQEALLRNNAAAAGEYFKLASAFSPDDNDRLAKSAYFYEAVMVLHDRLVENFHKPYADFLLAKGDTTAALRAVTELTLADPSNINLLNAYYQKAPIPKVSFATYWAQVLNAKLKPAETFKLTSLDNQTFDYSQFKGKWVLIDFWGTWCKPCVEELPRFQKFYDELRRSNRQNIVVLTAACHDTEPRVREFMQKQTYTFPVALVDDSFIKQFRVGEYPTKVLITPQGNRMKIPFGTNWDERVRIYTEN